MTYLSYRSPLIDIASSGKHHEVKVDPISLQRLIGWVDAMCPYMGDEEIRQMDDPVFQGVDWLGGPPTDQDRPADRPPRAGGLTPPAPDTNAHRAKAAAAEAEPAVVEDSGVW